MALLAEVAGQDGCFLVHGGAPIRLGLRRSPAARLFGAIVAVAKRLQSGRLDVYLLYLLIALIAVIALVTAMA